ncbi:MAG: sugar transferase [Bacteroidetes bacterium]|nr:sugar transferase [Bacteroidota bacterium]
MIRFVDICISIVGIIFLAPIFILIAVLIVLGSKGGVFYLQKRVGLYGQIFTLYKFRTMTTGADKSGLLTIGNDSRITAIGKILRKYKLDEFPQLINVINGNMSIVGPRPEVEEYVNLYTEQQREILKVKPGITDLASIHFSNENEILGKVDNPRVYYIEVIMPAKIDFNMEYIKNPTLKNYFKIIFKTILKIFR